MYWLSLLQHIISERWPSQGQLSATCLPLLWSIATPLCQDCQQKINSINSSTYENSQNDHTTGQSQHSRNFIRPWSSGVLIGNTNTNFSKLKRHKDFVWCGVISSRVSLFCFKNESYARTESRQTSLTNSAMNATSKDMSFYYHVSTAEY